MTSMVSGKVPPFHIHAASDAHAAEPVGTSAEAIAALPNSVLASELRKALS
jgi:hypothetical protein